MKRRVVQSGMVFLIAIIVSIFLVNGFEFWLDEKIASEYKDANYSNLFKSYSEDMNKGQVALNGSANNDDVLLMGSSELYAAVDQNLKTCSLIKNCPTI